MAVARINDIDLYYEVHGDGDPLVLVAGYTCDHAFWSGVVPGLAKRFRVVTFDNRAVGRTKDAGHPFSIETMAADTAGLIRHLGLFRPAIVGQSMGGAIAQTMLARFPDACGRCVIVNSTSSFSPAAIMALESLLALRRAQVDDDFLIDAALRWLSGFAWLSTPGNIAGFKAAISEHPAPQSLADQERQMAALRDFQGGVQNARMDNAALVVSATEDLLTPPSEGRKLARSLGARFVEIPGGHPSPVEHPALVVQILTDFLMTGAV